ncbi:hypothetical protein KDA11_04715 [Candidatus Saccharibacteria bacterium]|nr:hypothetical protein [Candidatus Saccharibacteria bacterium]
MFEDMIRRREFVDAARVSAEMAYCADIMEIVIKDGEACEVPIEPGVEDYDVVKGLGAIRCDQDGPLNTLLKREDTREHWKELLAIDVAFLGFVRLEDIDAKLLSGLTGKNNLHRMPEDVLRHCWKKESLAQVLAQKKSFIEWFMGSTHPDNFGEQYLNFVKYSPQAMHSLHLLHFYKNGGEWKDQILNAYITRSDASYGDVNVYALLQLFKSEYSTKYYAFIKHVVGYFKSHWSGVVAAILRKITPEEERNAVICRLFDDGVITPEYLPEELLPGLKSTIITIPRVVTAEKFAEVVKLLAERYQKE